MQSKSLPQSIPNFQNQAAGAVFAVLLLLFFFEDAEGFAREIKFYEFMDALLPFFLFQRAIFKNSTC
jgi:hypothetical protein